MGEYFLVSIQGEVIKLNKGIPEEKVNELLGMEYKTQPGKGPDEQRRVYFFKSINNNNNTYKLLMRDGLLEWVMQTY